MFLQQKTMVMDQLTKITKLCSCTVTPFQLSDSCFIFSFGGGSKRPYQPGPCPIHYSFKAVTHTCYCPDQSKPSFCLSSFDLFLTVTSVVPAAFAISACVL
jgi:hypothetical protein